LDMESNLDKIRKLTADLQDFGSHSYMETPSRLEIVLEAGEGEGEAIGLYKNQEIAVCRAAVKGGTRWPAHYHEAWEYIVVYQGEMHIENKIEDSKGGLKEREGIHVVKAPGIYYMRPRVLHEVYFPVDSLMIAITVPAAEGFPGVG